MALTNFLVNQLLQDYFGTGQFLALHISDPTNAGLATTELSTTTMPTYARQPVSWSTPVNRAVTNTNLIQWLALPAVNIGYLGVWDAVTGGDLLAVMECLTPFEISQAGAAIHLPPATLAVTIGGSPPAPVAIPAAPTGASGSAPVVDISSPA